MKRHASGAVMNEGTLYVYYSTAFPRFAGERKRLEQQNPALAHSFQLRYELWLAVHALLMHQEREGSQDATADAERQERCRLAAIAAMVASQEVRSGAAVEDVDAA